MELTNENIEKLNNELYSATHAMETGVVVAQYYNGSVDRNGLKALLFKLAEEYENGEDVPYRKEEIKFCDNLRRDIDTMTDEQLDEYVDQFVESTNAIKEEMDAKLAEFKKAKEDYEAQLGWEIFKMYERQQQQEQEEDDDDDED